MPDWKNILRERLAHLQVSPVRAEEIIEELSADLEQHYLRALARGSSPEDSHRAALAALGSTHELTRRIREIEKWAAPSPSLEPGAPRGRQMLANLLQDVRYGARSLGRSPMFTLVAMLTLALGIGANTAVFSAVYGVLLRPLPFVEPERLVWLWGTFSSGRFASVSPPDFLDYRARTESFELLGTSIGGTGSIATSLSSAAEPVRLNSAVVTAGFFETLGARPLMGRTFSNAEERDGANAVAILSHGLWQRQFGSDPNIVGRELTLDRKPATVVGIMPPDFDYPRGAELWRPLAFGSADNSVRRFHFLRPIGRLKQGVTLQQAEAELNTIAVQLEKAYPDSNTTWRIRLEPLLEVFVGNVRTTLWVMLGAVTFVLLIACANVANLLLARGSGRQREMAIRQAMGASRGRIVGQLLTESALLAVMAGALGFFLAYGATQWLQSLGPGYVPRQAEIRIEPWMLGVTLAAAVLTGLVFGMAPALQALRQSSADALREGGRSGSGRKAQRLRGVLVVTEFALSLVLLVGAGLLLRTFWNLSRVDLGFGRENLLTTHVALDEETYRDEASYARFFRELFQRVDAVPGVRATAGSNLRPLRGYTDMSFSIQGRPPLPEGQKTYAQNRVVTRNYFQVLGIRVLSGRVFAPEDAAGSPPVMMINEAFAQQFFADEDPIGKVVWIDGNPPRPAQIIGVVSGARQWTTQTPQPEMYRVLDQFPMDRLDLLIQTDVRSTSVVPAIRSALREIDRALPFAEFRAMDDVAGDTIAQERFTAKLMVGFAAVALALAAVGITGVLSNAVAQRTHEIGVRMALGANARAVVRMVLSQGLRLALVGTALGVAGSLALTRLMQPLLFGVQPFDAATFGVVAAMLLAVAAGACWIPARRAARVDPLVALRHE